MLVADHITVIFPRNRNVTRLRQSVFLKLSRLDIIHSHLSLVTSKYMQPNTYLYLCFLPSGEILSAVGQKEPQCTEGVRQMETEGAGKSFLQVC